MKLTTFQTFEIALEGRLDIQGSASLRQQMMALLARQDDREEAYPALWILGLTKVDFIDSAGLSSLIATFKLVRQLGHSLVVCKPQPSVRMVFEIVQLDRAIPIFDSYDGAIAAWKAADFDFPVSPTAA